MSVKLAKRLAEPDYWTCPHGRRTRPEPLLTYGPEVADLNATIGFEPDAQQELGLDLIFAIRPDGSPASFEFCAICCRQNLKTGLFKQAAIGWLFVTEQPLIVWSAHEMSTTTEAQRDIANLMLDSPLLRKRMMPNENDGIYYANGAERIELASGQRIMFKARTKDGGRGLAAPKLILDEAFALKPSMMGALLPLMLAQTHPQVLYGSSAGKADSEVLHEIRERGRVGGSPALTYLEWLAPPEDCADKDCQHPKDAVARGLDCALDREHLLLAANPAVATGRINLETIRNLRQALPAEEFKRECLGWWDELGSRDAAIPLEKWAALEIPTAEVPAGDPDRYGLAMSPERVASIAVAIKGDPAAYLDLAELDRVDDSRKLVDWLVERCKRPRRGVVMVDTRDPAASYAGELRTRGVQVNVTTQSDSARAFGGLLDAVNEGRIWHCGQPAIRAALSVVEKKPVGRTGQTWEWDPSDPTAEAAALRAMTLAHYGLSFGKTRRKSSGARRAVVL